MPNKTVLILGANSDVAKECVKLYLLKGFRVIMASRNIAEMEKFAAKNPAYADKIELKYFDATDFDSHKKFYQELTVKPSIVLYAAGFLVQNEEAFGDFGAVCQMAKTNYLGAVSILSIIAFDKANQNLERIIGLSSLSGVRGRKSNFIYGSTKAAFTTYLAGLRQELSTRKVKVNVFVLGYIDSKINQGLSLNKSLIMTPVFVADKIVNVGNPFVNVPNIKWKVIYSILKLLPESLVSKLP